MASDLAASARGDEGNLSAVTATRFGGYTLVAKLGQGAMAEVFLALRTGHAGFRKLVVIKRLHPHLLEESGVREMFLDEARLAALLSHSNVVTTNEVSEAEGRPYMAMEYLDGQALSALIARCASTGTPLPPAIVARIASDALDGLQHAHDLHDLNGEPLHVVHRDVSPHNLFVTLDGTTKVLDFGVAKASLHLSHTEIGAIKGKYAYLSPEQAEQRDVDARADVWGMGVVLWECLTGRRLFKRDTEVATIKAVTADEIPPVRRVAVDAPQELAAIVDKALRRDPDERYPSAHAMREDLERYLRGLPQPVSQRDVGKFLRSLFADDIAQRREAIAARVRGEVGDVSDAVMFGESTHPSYSETGARPRSRARTSLLLLIAVALTMVTTVAAVWAFVLPELGTSVATVEPVGASTPEPATPELAQATTAPEPEAPAALRVEAELAPAADAPVEPAPAAEVAAPVAPRARRERRIAPSAEAAPAAETGTLFLDTTPWTSVHLGGRSLGDTPLSNVELPAGRHVLTLRNPERGIDQTYTVVIEAGRATRRRVGLR